MTASWQSGPLVSVTSLTPRCWFLIYAETCAFLQALLYKKKPHQQSDLLRGRRKTRWERKKSHRKHAQFLFRWFFLALCFAPMCTHSNTSWFIYLFLFIFATKWMLLLHVLSACLTLTVHSIKVKGLRNACRTAGQVGMDGVFETVSSTN